jgi:hypothetical protein
LHAPPQSESARAQISRTLESDGVISLTAQIGAGKSIGEWQREAKDRLEIAKRCDALALLRADDSESFVGDLLDIGVNERKEMSGARGAPMPCAVLDKTGEDLPINGALFGIQRFNVNRAEWAGEFRAWLDAARASPAVAAQ